jgi:hypothetical protein
MLRSALGATSLLILAAFGVLAQGNGGQNASDHVVSVGVLLSALGAMAGLVWKVATLMIGISRDIGTLQKGQNDLKQSIGTLHRRVDNLPCHTQCHEPQRPQPRDGEAEA